MPKRVQFTSNIPLPKVVRSRDRGFASWANDVRRSLSALAKSKPTVGVPRRTGKSRYPDLFEPLTAFATSGAGSVEITMQPGYVREIVPLPGDDAIELHKVYYNGSILTTGTTILVPSSHWVVCKVQQDDEGAVKTGSSDDPEIVVQSAVTDSDHWQPATATTSGTDGTMYYPLYQISVVASQPSFDFRHLGPIEVKGKDRGDDPSSGGEDLNLTIITQPVSLVSIATTDRVMIANTGETSEVHYWRNGLYVGTDDPDGLGEGDGVAERSVTYLVITA